MEVDLLHNFLPLLLCFGAGITAGWALLARSLVPVPRSFSHQNSGSSERSVREDDRGEPPVASPTSLFASPSRSKLISDFKSLALSVDAVQAELRQLRQEAAQQKEAATEKLTETSTLLFSLWSQSQQQELNEHLDRLRSQVEGQVLSMDIQVRHLTETATQLPLRWMEKVGALSERLGVLERAVAVLQGQGKGAPLEIRGSGAEVKNSLLRAASTGLDRMDCAALTPQKSARSEMLPRMHMQSGIPGDRHQHGLSSSLQRPPAATVETPALATHTPDGPKKSSMRSLLR